MFFLAALEGADFHLSLHPCFYGLVYRICKNNTLEYGKRFCTCAVFARNVYSLDETRLASASSQLVIAYFTFCHCCNFGRTS